MTIFEQEILPLFATNREAWLKEARDVARALGRTGRLVTINHVREICPPPEGVDPRVNGAVFKKSEWENMGYVGSDRAECHGRPVAQFRLRG